MRRLDYNATNFGATWQRQQRASQNRKTWLAKTKKPEWKIHFGFVISTKINHGFHRGNEALFISKTKTVSQEPTLADRPSIKVNNRD
jgi:hypothetical protein